VVGSGVGSPGGYVGGSVVGDKVGFPAYLSASTIVSKTLIVGVIVGGEYVTTETTSVLEVGALEEVVCNVGINNDTDEGSEFEVRLGVGDDVVDDVT
jgi:hypothetical protein